MAITKRKATVRNRKKVAPAGRVRPQLWDLGRGIGVVLIEGEAVIRVYRTAGRTSTLSPRNAKKKWQEIAVLLTWADVDSYAIGNRSFWQIVGECPNEDYAALIMDLTEHMKHRVQDKAKAATVPDTLQELTLDSSFWPGFAEGGERYTVRAGKRDIHEGKLLFKAITGGKLTGETHLAEVTKVWHTTLQKVETFNVFKDRGATARRLLKNLKPFYPELTVHSDVSVIYFVPAAT